MNEADLTAIHERLDTIEANLQVLLGSEETVEITATLSTLQEQMDGLSLGVEEHEQDLYILTEEIHQLSDEIAALRMDVNAHEGDIAGHSAAIADNTDSTTTNANAIAAIEADYLTSTTQASLQATIDANTTTNAALNSAVNGNTSAITANTNAIAINTAAVASIASDYLTSAEQSSLQAGIDANTTSVAANTTALTTISGDYLTSAEQSSLQAAIDANTTSVAANTADVGTIQSSYLPWIDDVSTYLDADITNNKVTVLAADLEVEDHVYGKTFSRQRCGGTTYNCTPTECQSLCQAIGGRMAFMEEALAWASAGNNQCAWMWMLEDTPSTNRRAYPIAAYPMFNNRTSSGCGPLNTGDVPRLAGYNTFSGDDSNWSLTNTYDCACSSLK